MVQESVGNMGKTLRHFRIRGQHRFTAEIGRGGKQWGGERGAQQVMQRAVRQQQTNLRHARCNIRREGIAGSFLRQHDRAQWRGQGSTFCGSEALLGEVGNWQRVASLRPFPLLGGAAASREAWRCALALCWEAGVTWSPLECFEEWEPAEHYALLHHAWQRGVNCPLTSSIGRLFDAAAAVLGLCAEQSYEGEAAQRLEAQSFSGGEVCVLPLQMRDGICYADWEPLLAMLRDEGRSVAQRAASFHASLAQMLVSQAQQVRREYGIEQVGLSGGVFQNRCLTEMALAGLAQAGFQTYVPERLPLNDAAISFGQIVAAAY